MNVEKVKATIAYIESIKDDDRQAHIAEDSLYEDILKSIAEDNCDDPKGCALLALTSGNIEFSRWYS